MIIYMRNYLLPLLALICLCLPALHPFLQNQMPLTDDGTLHLYRIIALDDAIQQTGNLYPRYAPGLVYGYGAPLFNYFSPLAYYPSVLLHHLSLNYTQAWLSAMCFYIVLAAVGAYLWGTQWTNRAGGFITAAAYIYAPYFLFDAVRRGTLTEVAALALLPMVLWAFGKLGQKISAWFLATLLFAVFIPLHNIVTILGLGLLLPYCGLLWLTAQKKFRMFLALFSAGVFGVLLTTFFWLPALGETGNVKINAIAENLNFVDVTQSLRPLSEIFIPTFTADPTQLQQPIPIVVGWLPIILAVTTMLLLVLKKSPLALRHENKSVHWLFWLCAFVAFIMVVLNVDTPLSVWLWETIPLLGYTQFAWRTLGIASLALAMLAGISGAALIPYPAIRHGEGAINRRYGRNIFFISILVASCIIYSLPWLVALYAPLPAENISDAQNHERITGQLALSSYSEYLPNWVETPPNPETFVGQKNPLSRLIPPAGVTIQAAEWRGTSATIALSSVTPVTLVFDWLYVPGWSAQFTNTPSKLLPLSTKPAAPHGLVSVEIPAGEHVLAIGLEATPLQALANGIALFAFSGWLLAVSVWIGRKFVEARYIAPLNEKDASSAQLNAEQATHHENPVWRFLVHNINGQMIVLGITLLCIKMFIVDVVPNPLRAEYFGEGNVSTHNLLEANFGGQIQLIGVTLPEKVETGDFAHFSAFWQLFSGSIQEDYSSIYQLRNSTGLVIAETGSFAPGNRATSAWLPSYYLQEILTLEIPIGTPPGIYTLDAGLYTPETGERLSLFNAAGNPEDVKITLGQIEILPPKSASFAPEKVTWLNAEIGFAGLLTPLPEKMTVGDELILALQWVAQQSPTQEYHFRLVWQQDNQTFFGSTLPLITDFPVMSWQAGDVWNGQHTLIVPGDLAAGKYQVLVQLLAADKNAIGENIEIGEMIIAVPERTFVVPEMPFSSAAVWRNGIRLLGYAIQGRVTGVTLVWQTEALIDQNLRLFVHVLDGETIVAQWDGIPADWTRPTTSWLPDEVITTQHLFNVPDGNYDIRVGWYDPKTNRRIQLTDATELFSLAALPD